MRLIRFLPIIIASIFFSSCGGGNEPRTVVAAAGDSVGSPTPSPTSSPTPTMPTEALFFGGMYGQGSSTVFYPNPIMSAQSCPTNYKSQLVLGTLNVDWPATLCFQQPADGVTGLYDFGGMYSTAYNNPLTGGQSCPTGFFTSTLLSSSNTDNTLKFCYRVRPPGAAPFVLFGGMYGGYGGSSTAYPNPVTGAYSCPTGYTRTQVYGSAATATFNGDMGLSICTKPPQ
ncbi:MAG: hypothetical protein JWQ35_2705 [Bacteriovoracaceae bacterium]|nr:hypothetical protein [Bacteriovoracaceae bacterium]